MPLIKKINEMGHISLCLDRDINAEGFKYAKYYSAIDIIDNEKCLQYAKKNKIDGVLTVATDFPIETVSYIAQEMNLIGIPLQTAKLVKDKYLVKKLLYENGIYKSIQFFEISDENQLTGIASVIKYPVIVKPCDGSGSKAIEKIEDVSNLKQAVHNAINSSISKKAFIETFIEGKEYGVESFVVNGKVYVLGILKKHMTNPPYYAELGHSLPSGLTDEIENDIKETVKRAINVLGITNGSVNMDLILSNNNEPNIIDIGARMGGNVIGSHIIPNAKGINILENLVNLVLGNKVDLEEKFRKNISTRILNFSPGKLISIGNVKDLIDKKNVIDIILNKHPGDMVTQYRTNADSCGWVVVSADTYKETEKLAITTRNKIEKMFDIERR